MNIGKVNEICEFLLRTNKDYYQASRAFDMPVRDIAKCALEGNIVRCPHCDVWHDSKNLIVFGSGYICSVCLEKKKGVDV